MISVRMRRQDDLDVRGFQPSHLSQRLWSGRPKVYQDMAVAFDNDEVGLVQLFRKSGAGPDEEDLETAIVHQAELPTVGYGFHFAIFPR